MYRKQLKKIKENKEENNKIEKKIEELKLLKGTSGITLVALVVTIVVLIILATITINIALNGGIADKAQKAKMLYENEEEKEQAIFQNVIERMNEIEAKVPAVEEPEYKLKVDVVDGKMGFKAFGALCIVVDSKGEPVMGGDGNPRIIFVSDGETTYEANLNLLEEGDYFLRVWTPPEGYKAPSDIPFSVKYKNGDVYIKVVLPRTEPIEEENAI